MQQVVRLLGDLGERYGAEHTYCNLRTPAEAIKLLCINIPALRDELVQAHEHGIGYRLIQADADLGYEDLRLPIGSNDLILTPVIAGSGGGGTGQILAGVGLIAASFLFPGAGLFGATSFFGATATAGIATTVGTALSAVGAGLVLTGAAELISPTPQPTALKEQEQLESFTFSGIVNVSRQGIPVPVVLGRAYAGSVVISSGLDVV